jgi:carbamoyl-phosphate synthase small subunit
MKARLILKDGAIFEGESFGAEKPVAGEVVFSTGMVGYPESLTDPSFLKQILVFTYPMIGSYGVPDKKYWESDKIQTTAVIVSDYIDTPSHFHSQTTLSKWLKEENIPGLMIKDTRLLAKKIRETGVILGKIVFTEKQEKEVQFVNPDDENLVELVSAKKLKVEGKGKKTVVLIDGGGKRNIKKSLLKRGVKVITVPWNYDFFKEKIKFDAVFISNGPGDPKKVTAMINIVKQSLKLKIPTFGICLGHQVLALAAGGDTYKLKFGHRGQNQPCILVGSNRCYLTTQNHGFAVSKVPKGFKPWFVNANDGTNEGIIHTKLPFFSVQFHPEVTPGPNDTEWLFDYFIKRI